MSDQLQADLVSAMSAASQIEDEISSGKKVNVPSDNPVVYAQVSLITAQQSANTQYNTNLQAIQSFGTTYESTFDNINGLLTQAKQLALRVH